VLFLFGTGELGVLVQQGHQLAVDARVGGHAFFLVEEMGFASEVANQAARFGHQQ